MNANEYLQRSKLYRKLSHSPHGEFSRVYAARLSDEGLAPQCTRRSLKRGLTLLAIIKGHASHGAGAGVVYDSSDVRHQKAAGKDRMDDH